MSIPKVHAFVETGECRPPKRGEWILNNLGGKNEPSLVSYDALVDDCWRIVRRLGDDWLERAVERIRAYGRECAMRGKEGKCRDVTAQTIIAAILGPDPEPEPEEWEVEAAESWYEDVDAQPPHHDVSVQLARHFAKHRRAQERKQT